MAKSSFKLEHPLGLQGKRMVDDDGGVSRRATFGELLTEAQELDALCEADVGVLVFDSAGRQIDYCSPRTSWSELTQRYKSISNNKFQGINRDDDHQDWVQHDH